MKGYRTVVANALMSVLPILELSEFAAVLPIEWMPYYTLGVVLANMWLRSLTTTPLGKQA